MLWTKDQKKARQKKKKNQNQTNHPRKHPRQTSSPTMEQTRDSPSEEHMLEAQFSELTLKKHFSKFALKDSIAKLTLKDSEENAYQQILSVIDSFNKSQDHVLKTFLNTDCFIATPQIEEFFKKNFAPMLEKAKKGRVFSNGENFLLTGIRGVGKTTLLKM